MRRRAFIGGLAGAALTGCATVRESNLNPFNWFGQSEPADRLTPIETEGVDPRNLVSQVTALRVEQVAGGAIVHATGLPPRQGYYDAELVPLNGERPENGVLTYQFRIFPPYEQTRVGTPRSREVIVGHFVSDQTLAGVRTIRVAGLQNALASRR